MKKGSRATTPEHIDTPPSSSEPRRKYDPEETRRNILEVATQEFSSMGLTGARVDAIAERTNTTKRMLYYYFGSKEGLYLAVLGVDVVLDVANAAIRLLQHGDVEPFLAAEVVVDHPLARARARGDLVDAGARQTRARELLGRDRDDVALRLLGVVGPRRFGAGGLVVRRRGAALDPAAHSGSPT